MSGREEHQQEKTGLQGDLGQEPICSCLSLPSKAGLDLLLLCQEELFSAGTPHLVQSPQGQPSLCSAHCTGTRGWCQIQTLSELEGELVLGAFSDLHIKPQQNICHKACDNSSSICNTDKPSHWPKYIPDLAPNAPCLTPL